MSSFSGSDEPPESAGASTVSDPGYTWVERECPVASPDGEGPQLGATGHCASGPPESGLVSASMVALQQAASVVLGECTDPAGSLATARMDVRQLRLVIDQLEAGFAFALNRVLDHGLYRDAGSISPVGWLVSQTRVGHRAAKVQTTTAALTSELPMIAAAWKSGSITAGHAQVFARLLSRLGVDVLEPAQRALIEVAITCTPEQLARALAQAGLDVAVAEKASRDLRAARHLNLSTTLHGMVRVDGLLDPDTGHLVKTVIDALAAPWVLPEDAPIPADAGHDREDDWPEAKARVPDSRRPGQRRADALGELARIAADSGRLPPMAGQRPHIAVHIDWDSFARATSATVRPVLDMRAPALPPARYPDATVVPDSTVQVLLSDADLTRVVLDADSQPLDVGRTARTATLAQRRALAVRDNGCRFPGCDRPGTWTQAHHIVYWRHGGSTDLANLISLCARHHHLVHLDQWSIETRPANRADAHWHGPGGLGGPGGTGTYHFRDPEGRVHPARNPRLEADLIAKLQLALANP